MSAAHCQSSLRSSSSCSNNKAKGEREREGERERGGEREGGGRGRDGERGRGEGQGEEEGKRRRGEEGKRERQKPFRGKHEGNVGEDPIVAELLEEGVAHRLRHRLELLSRNEISSIIPSIIKEGERGRGGEGERERGRVGKKKWMRKEGEEERKIRL